MSNLDTAPSASRDDSGRWIATIPNFFKGLPAQKEMQKSEEYRDQIYKPAQAEALQAAWPDGFARRMPVSWFSTAVRLNDMSGNLPMKERRLDIYGRGFDEEVIEFLGATSDYDATAECGDALFFAINSMSLYGTCALRDWLDMAFGIDFESLAQGSMELSALPDMRREMNFDDYSNSIKWMLELRKCAAELIENRPCGPKDLRVIYYNIFTHALRHPALEGVAAPLATAASIDIAKLVTRKGAHPWLFKNGQSESADVMIPDVYDRGGGANQTSLGMLAVVDVMSGPDDDEIILARGGYN
jgi:hypothetical protein